MVSLMKKIISLLFITLLFYACSSTRMPTPTTGSPDVEAYIQKYKHIAIREMKRTGIPASITLAQGILESKYGNSRLAREANNHFGIKCHAGWSGRKIYEDDDEQQECFRVYDNADESFIDHSKFLKNPRYMFLYKLKSTNYKGWAEGLKKADYATNPKYPQLLISLIEKYKLYQYDEKSYTHQTPALKEVFEFNRIKTIIVEKGMTPQKISQKYGITLKRLYKYNDLKQGDKIKAGDKIYLQPKRIKGNTKFHTVKLGETMHSISQEHGIKLPKLLERNDMIEDTEPDIGAKLFLRTNAKEPPRVKGMTGHKKVKYYTIKKGDTLYSIAQKFDLHVDELKKLNKMKSDDIKPGSKIIVGY